MGGWWWGGGVVQTDFRVKPTTKLLLVAFGLGCCCLAWLWGYDNNKCQLSTGSTSQFSIDVHTIVILCILKKEIGISASR